MFGMLTYLLRIGRTSSFTAWLKEEFAWSIALAWETWWFRGHCLGCQWYICTFG